MTTRQPINPGRIAWTGHNHCLFLEAGPQGPWTGAFTLFRVDHSLHGPGQGVFAVTAPEASSFDPANICITNNEKLFRWLASEIVAHFGAFKDRPAFRHLTFLPLSASQAESMPAGGHRETFEGGGRRIALEWQELEEAIFLELPPERTSTKRHEVFGGYITARRAAAFIDGRPVPGSVFEKPFFDRTTTTAYLIFSETWIEPTVIR